MRLAALAAVGYGLAFVMPANAFVDFLLDQLDEVPDVRAQAMFGGRGLYSGDLFFGIVFNDILYFKVNDQNRNDYVRAGMQPFKPYKDWPMTMRYYEVPAAVMENTDELCGWAQRAIAAAAEKKKAALRLAEAEPRPCGRRNRLQGRRVVHPPSRDAPSAGQGGHAWPADGSIPRWRLRRHDPPP